MSGRGGKLHNRGPMSVFSERLLAGYYDVTVPASRLGMMSFCCRDSNL